MTTRRQAKILKYYPNKINGKNHIFKNAEDVTPLCGMSGYPSSWESIPDEINKRSICRNCSSLRSGDHIFLHQGEWDNY